MLLQPAHQLAEWELRFRKIPLQSQTNTTRLAQDYIIGHFLGRGASGEVHLAWLRNHPENETPVVVKRVKSGLLKKSTLAELRKEAGFNKTLSHVSYV